MNDLANDMIRNAVLDRQVINRLTIENGVHLNKSFLTRIVFKPRMQTVLSVQYCHRIFTMGKNFALEIQALINC